MLENIKRHLDDGRTPLEAALSGAREVGFTVLSMSLSLIAVFIPLLFMGGLVGRLFREFAVTLSIAVAISLVISLTATPMLCARFLRPRAQRSLHRDGTASGPILVSLSSGASVRLNARSSRPSLGGRSRMRAHAHSWFPLS